MKQKIIYYQNKLKKIAEEALLSGITDEELKTKDVTLIFKDELKKIPKNKELLNLTINAQVTSGKSTLGMAINQDVLKEVFNETMTIKHVLRDQYEMMKFQKLDIQNTCIMIDEWDDMEESGENSTLVKKLRDQMSKVQAQRYIHKISCSPDNTNDALSDIVLEVIQKNEEAQMTRSKLFVRVLHGGIWHMQLIGYVDYSVANVLNKKWYADYRKRKFDKFDLITQHGVFKPRDLEYALLQKNVIMELKDMAKLGLTDSDTIMNFLEIEARKQKLEFSIIGSAGYVKRINGVLSQYGKIRKIKKELNIIEKSLVKNPNIKSLIEDREALLQAINVTGMVITNQLKELDRLIKVKKEYERI